MILWMHLERIILDKGNWGVDFMKRILILGGSGLVGKALINEISEYNEFEVYATYFQNPVLLNKNRGCRLNIEDASSINEILNSIKPHIVISCLRGDFLKQLNLHIETAEYLRENGGKLYFFSTTNVFDNDLKKPHYEDDLPGSCTAYGQFKIECEKTITEILKHNAYILRIPQVWGKDSPRMKLLEELLTNNNNKIVVYPKLFINTNTDIVIAKKAFYIIRNDLRGIFHLASEDIVNYKDFNIELIKGLGFHNANIEENYEEQGCFALLSKRNNEFPEELNVRNKAVIKYLIN